MQITVILIIIAVLLLLWLTAICPGRGRKEQMQVFSAQMIAHRGLHDNKTDAPENSLRAFGLAVEAGYGIELDVRLTKDQRVVVAHDDHLNRVAGLDRKISEMTFEELRSVHLYQSDQNVPAFSEVLEVIGGKVPVIVELKSEEWKEVPTLCELVQKELDAVRCTYCIESFNPAVVRWYRKNRPEILRGQLAEKYKNVPFPRSIVMFLFSCCVFNFLTRPDFIAYNHKERKLIRFRLMRDLYKPCMAAWTIKSEKSRKAAAADFEIMIFDSFRPS